VDGRDIGCNLLNRISVRHPSQNSETDAHSTPDNAEWLVTVDD
jgi:hypothetical protein